MEVLIPDLLRKNKQFKRQSQNGPVSQRCDEVNKPGAHLEVEAGSVCTCS